MNDYNQALEDLREYLMGTYQAEFDWEDIDLAIDNLRIPTEEDEK